MDSLTQIVLGAAAGEVVLGKKIGNRAMMWGAVGGTIPDLDVLGKFFLSNIDNLAFHRGFSHSILFSILGAFAFGWLVHQIYQSSYHKWIAIGFKALAFIIVGFALDFLFTIFFPTNSIPTIVSSIGLLALFYFHNKKKYFSNEWKQPEASIKDWQWLFFWSLITHPILDCFTMYGTQLFAPFSDVRVAWSTISVVDPIYTLPFLICLIVASRFRNTSQKRKLWNYSGIALSSAYLLFTVFNKIHINNVFDKAMAKEGIPTERFVTNAAILNNILWNCTAETKEHFYLGQYSLFDEGELSFAKINKNHTLLKGLDTDPTLKTLRWFSNDYFNVIQMEEGLQFNDLRFGSFTGKGDSPQDYIFKFFLTDRDGNGYQMEDAMGGPPKGSVQDAMADLWKRMWGNKNL
jgi:inner membrane protein